MPTDQKISRFRSAYTPGVRHGFSCDPKSDRTQQSFKADADINVIMSRYLKTGVLPKSREGEGQYVDTTLSAFDFQQASDQIASARGAFSRLSSAERDSYGNSVETWLDAIAQERATEAAAAAEAGGEAPPPAPKAPEAPVAAPAGPQTPPAVPGAGG